MAIAEVNIQEPVTTAGSIKRDSVSAIIRRRQRLARVPRVAKIVTLKG
jgi:hypothetical protein